MNHIKESLHLELDAVMVCVDMLMVHFTRVSGKTIVNKAKDYCIYQMAIFLKVCLNVMSGLMELGN